MTPAPWFFTWAAAGLVGDHLWQSTLFAAVVALLTLVLRNNRAQVRYWLWLAASVKFLVPFAALVAIGSQFGWRSSAPIPQPELTFVMDVVSQPFSQPEFRAAAAASPVAASPGVGAALAWLLVTIWLCGCAAILLTWVFRWRGVAAAVREASLLEAGREADMLRHLEQIAGIKKPIALVSSDTSVEPGVFRILKPVLLWPRSIGERLADAQVEAILAHEVCHVRRRDNLAAAVHMVVEAVFWFHPLVWWLGARLVGERERACDEEVIRWGSEPHVYAESILKTCELYLESPLVCVAGVTGSVLKKRIEWIMRNHAGETLNAWRKLLLTTAGLAAIAAPVAVGVLNRPRLAAQAPATDAAGRLRQGDGEPRQSEAKSGPAFEVASVRRNMSDDRRASIRVQPGGRLTVTNNTLRNLVRNAYRLQDFQIVGGPDWLNSYRFDIVAKADGNPAQEQLELMMQGLLTERFQLTMHREKRELPIYSLVMARSDRRMGAQLRQSEVECAALIEAARARGTQPPPSQPGERPTCGIRVGPGTITAGGATIPQLANALSPWVDRIVLDRTGLTGGFDVDLKWTPDQMPPRPPGSAFPDAPAPPLADGPSIFTAVQEQLGLKLESQRGPVDVLVIDRAEQPREDVGLTTAPAPSPPPAPSPRFVAQSPAADASSRLRQGDGEARRSEAKSGPAFEVASVKPNKSGDQRVMLLNQPGGRFTATNSPLRLLIRIAYRIQDVQISGGPSWLTSDRFDVMAKAEGNPSPDELSSMIRALLADRFKLTVHNETRELPVYALLLARSDGKLGSRFRPTDCAGPDNPPPPVPPDPSQPQPCGTVRTGLGRLTLRGMPLSQIAQSLSPLVNRVVVDRTGLTGNFDLDLEWTPDQLPQGSPPAGAPPLPPIDPNGSSIFTALQEQLGLKLESTKGPVDVLVIDRVEQSTPD